MNAQDYACVTVRGRAPWGFQLRQKTHRRVQVHQVEEGSHASMAGLCEDDELVSVNGVSCSSLSLAEVIVLIEKATDCLQLLVKRCCLFPQQKSQSFNTTLKASWRELREPYKSENVDEAHYEETNSDTECPAGNTMVRTQFCIPAPKDRTGPDTCDSYVGTPRLEITPGAVVELQLSLSQTTLEDTGCTSLGSARGVTGDLCHETNTENDTTTNAPGCSLYIPLHDREPLSQRGVLVSSPSALLGQVEVTIQPSGRDSGTKKVGAVGTEATANEQRDYVKGEGGHTDDDPTSFSVSFGIPSEEEDSESERELNKPNKHRPRHARLRRRESLSEKQVKEAKSKCKRIALLLTAAAPNPNNKGLLMFKKHRQRAKQFTLVSYGTGENEPEFENEDDEYSDKETHAVEFTVLATSETDIDEDFFTNSPGHKNIVTFDLDTGLLEIERKLYNQEEMNALPETKGKGALMFAQRRQRIDEISAEHEDMRSKGIPVEGIQEAEENYQQENQHSCIQTSGSQNYIDVNVQHQQYQQYQEQHYQQQQQHQYQEFQQQMQYHQQQQHYQQQQEFQQGQQYQPQQSQQQQQVQQYFHNLNGVSSQQTNVAQSSVINRSAKPFSVQNTVAAPFSPSANQAQSYYSDGQGEQIASRDERISVPAIKTGLLQDTRRKNKAKPMFTFKEPHKVSPNPELLNLLNRKDKKTGFDSGTEEDYLSLGAEACNFLQSTKVKNKTPPPVAPKPHIHTGTPPWSPQPEITSQQFNQDDENNIPVTSKDPVTEIDSSAIPEEETSRAHVTDQNEASSLPHSQVQPDSANAWGLSETQIQSGQQTDTWHENQSQPQLLCKPEPVVSSWGPSSTQALKQPPVPAWGSAEVPSQALAQNQSQMQPPWVTRSQVLSEVQPHTAVPAQSQPEPSWVTQSHPQHQPHPHSQINTWATAPTESPHQPPWAQSQVSGQASVSTWSQDLNQPQVQLSWAQQQHESQPIPPWTASQQQPQSHWIQPQSQPQPQTPWASQTQQQTLPPPPVNTWNQSQCPVNTQSPWTHQAKPSSQPPAQIQQQQNPWTSVHLQSQPHSAWVPQPQEHPQQTMNSWAPEQNKIQTHWNQPQSPAQAQSPWSHPPQQQTPPQSQSQTVLSTWTPQPQQGPAITSGSTESQKFSQPVKPWSPSQTTQPPLPPHQLKSNTPISKVPSHMPGMPRMGSASGMGPAFEMPALRGKGAELFAKRQSRMEKYVVDSSTVQANKALGRSSSLSPPVRLSPLGLGSRSASVSPSPTPSSHATPLSSYTSRLTERQVFWLEKGRKPPTPWEAASRHPLGLVDEAFAHQDMQHSIASNLRSAAHRKMLPEPPAEWKAKVAYEPSPKSQSWRMNRSPLSFLSPTKSTASAPAAPVPYGSPLRQSQPSRSLTEASLGSSVSGLQYQRPLGHSIYRSTYSNTYRW
ncbi:synaptopodin-2 isoform X2 [Tachysurus fulvidraco]|uniref:synaptopodin-2 isoform X2 n=1 Tax=Tachysurus fulvidraco TaxID=1234273 RepID=UPI000F4E3224|nr:synaptopodin-2 isoform X2 [Tachysurus fulvidraco]